MFPLKVLHLGSECDSLGLLRFEVQGSQHFYVDASCFRKKSAKNLNVADLPNYVLRHLVTLVGHTADQKLETSM